MECSQAFPSSEKPFPLLIRDEIHQAAGYGDHLAHGKSIESLFDLGGIQGEFFEGRRVERTRAKIIHSDGNRLGDANGVG